MKNHFKCLLSLFLVVIMLVPMISATGLTVTAATDETCGDNLTWSFDTATGVLKIDGTGDMYDYSSEYYNGSLCTTAPWKIYISYIKSVVISDSVTSIGSSAFEGCTSLTSVTIGNSVTSIGSSAFEDCTSLTSVTIPDSVTSIGEGAFVGCASLTSVTVDANNQYYASFDGVLYNNDLTDLIQYPIGNSRPTFIIPDSVTSIGNRAFYYCYSLTSVTIGNSVTSIGSHAFYDCDSLTSVTIGNSVTSIGSSAFEYCSSLTSVTIGNSVTSIGDGAFADCTSLASVTIGNSVTSIGYAAFLNCTSLTSVTIPDSVTSIGEGAFVGCASLTSVTVDANNQYYASFDGVLYNNDLTDLIQYPIGNSRPTFIIPDSVTSIGEYAFALCSSLTSVTIPDFVTSIGECAFASCDSLTSVTIPDSVTSIGYAAFRDCTSLTSVTIGNFVTSIGEWAFAYCSSLTSVTIPDLVPSVGDGTFRECTSLTSVTIGNSVTSIGDWAFDSCDSLTSVTIPDSVKSIGSYAFEGCTSLTSVTIGNFVTSIGSSAFEDCTFLTSVTIPDSVTSIGGSAFYNTAYYNNSSNWENDVLYIGNHLIKAKNSISGAYSIKDGTLTIAGSAFFDCTSLTSVTIPDSVISIGNSAFAYCSLTSVTIPDSVTSIGEGAFNSCRSLTDVTIPDSVTSIGDYAFASCRSLTDVTIPDSVTSIGRSAFYNTAYYNNSSNWENDVLYIGNHLIKAKNSISGAYSIKDGTLTIAGSAFEDCTSLTSVTIPDSVTSIGVGAFESCTSLTSVTIPDSVTSIGSYAFHYFDYDSFSYYKLDLTIKCYENSYAHTYAKNNGFKYELISNHIFTNYISDNNATCTEDGTKTAYCDLGCGATDIITDEGTAFGHTWSEWIVSIEPTYTTEGEQIRFCYVCDIVENKIIPAVTNPEEDVLDRFEDVNKNAWYADAVRYCVTMGYAKGMSETVFAPNATLTRAQFVQLLAGIDGVDLTQYNETDSTFKDVKVGSWFHNAITWAVRNEYVAGMSADSFKPNDNLTRQQLVRILYNYAKDNGVDVTGRADLTVYEDCDKIAEWAYEELSWAVYNKIVSGMTETTVGPRGTATRAQAMQIIKQFDALTSN